MDHPIPFDKDLLWEKWGPPTAFFKSTFNAINHAIAVTAENNSYHRLGNNDEQRQKEN